MKRTNSRKGSALLIVLGMMAFMIISAVAFSAYMRTSRLPSSYLRRTAASRLLAKAALAEAIERVDVAVNDNVYPDQRAGIRVPSARRLIALGETDTSRPRNYWYHNVFIGSNAFMRAEDTVSTLTLEGLAYLPPPLVNDVRRYSRLSRAATWHTMGFDAGRYAYCAVDVSDCLDVNRLVADSRRNSGGRRVTLAHMFENSAHTGYERDPKSWDDFMKNFRESLTESDEATNDRFVPGKVPLVSMADWNLAVHALAPSGVESPFAKYVENGGGANFYGIGGLTGPAVDKIRSLRLVSDSLIPPGELDSSEVDLASDGQPFNANFLDQKPTFMQMVTTTGGGSMPGMRRLAQSLTLLDLCCLYDYLDKDSIPVSLSLPTTEQVPMFCGIRPTFGNAVFQGTQTTSQNTSGSTVTRRTEYSLNPNALLSGLAGMKAIVAFPFKRADPGNFTYDGCIRLFFADPASFSGLRGMKNLRPPTPNGNEFKEEGYANGVFKISIPQNSLPSFKDVMEDTEAVKDIQIALANRLGPVKTALNTPVFWVERQVQIDPSTGQPNPSDPGTITAAGCNIVPVDGNGNPIQKFADNNQFKTYIENGGADAFALHMAVYLRVKKGNDTVDLVPASAADDALNGVMNVQAGVNNQLACGLEGPVLRFSSTATVAFSDSAWTTMNTPANFPTDGLICPDPRFNHAPEDWMASSVDTAAGWLNAVNPTVQDRDGDIFMFVSNQNYMQSVYELAFLPNISDLDKSGKNNFHGYYEAPSRDAYAADITQCFHYNLFWKTYRCYDGAAGNRHDFERLGLVLNDGAFRVNPFSQSIDALMAAFANTPYDWSVASTNDTLPTSLSDSECRAKKFNEEYAFSEMNDMAKFAWADLKNVAENFRDRMRSANGDWEGVFDNLGWDADEFCQPAGKSLTSTDPLDAVDRKFLYGFWHDAFANRQQLFLVFVRAEPMMMGGGSVNSTPPALGARAVALVWRDPEGSSGGVDVPHRTRVLMYRQFE